MDLIQAVHKRLLRQMPVMLSDDALWLLRPWVRVYTGEDLLTINDLLFDYRKEALTKVTNEEHQFESAGRGFPPGHPDHGALSSLFS